MYSIKYNIINFIVMIYFNMFVYTMISCGKYHEIFFCLCLKIYCLRIYF